MSKAQHTPGPELINGKGWDVRQYDGELMCEGRGPYTLAQAQLAFDNYRKDESARAAIAKEKGE